MDPVSIAASSASLAVFCLKVAAAVYTTTDSVRNVDTNFSGLHQELMGFSGTLSAIEKTWKQNTAVLMAYSGPDATLWTSVTENLDNSKLTIEMLEKALTNVKKGGFFGHGILSKPTKAVKLSLSMSDITAYQHRINSHHIAMQGGLQMISLCLHIKGNASLQSLDTSLANLGDMIKLISQRAEAALQGNNIPSSDPSQEENGNSNIASGLQSMARAAEAVFTSASTVIDGRRSTIYGGSVIGENAFQNDGGIMWGGSVLGSPLTEEQYSGIENWIPPPAKDKEDGSTSQPLRGNLPTTGNPTKSNTDFLGRAIDAVKQAISLDNAKDYENAYKQYYICLELFMLAIKFEKNSESKRIMQNKAAEYMDRAEKLKAYLHTQATGIPIRKEVPVHTQATGIPIRKEAPVVSRNPENPRIPLVLPPSTSIRRFEDYIVQAENICGSDNVKIVTRAEETFKKLLDALDILNLNISDRDNLFVSAIVRPRKGSEAQEIIRLCNTFEIPVWSFSSGSEDDYRAAIPRVPGSIGLDFGSYMNKVLGVNESGAFVVVEPGATYADIDKYLVDNKLSQKFVIDRPKYTERLTLGNAVEGNTSTLYCGKEIILPNGDLLRTGLIQYPGMRPQVEQLESEEKQSLNSSSGVSNGKLLSENGLGIAVKLLVSNPVDCQPYQIEFPEADLPKIVQITQKLRQTMVLQRSPSLHYVPLDTSTLGLKSSNALSDAPVNSIELDGINPNRWRLHGTIYGERRVCDTLCQVIKEAFIQVEGAKFNFAEQIQEEESALHVSLKQPGETINIGEPEWTKWIPNGPQVFFRLTSKVSGEIAYAQLSIMKKRIEDAEFHFMGAFTIDERHMHYTVYIAYEPHDSNSCRRLHKLIRTLVDDCEKNGWREYWTYGALMDQIAATRDAPDDALAKINTAIKDAVDPAGIMEPGRNGVWPTRSDKSVWKRMADRSLVE
ncbi:hypothetical protein V501_03991 [Pseudogymnoascus sp. VKM F-4519 (FW-2642)]|nr:hypothetical protein V501_03991 [Pseudogymnoascus sp. VKM F-4519 (FW-2642)]